MFWIASQLFFPVAYCLNCVTNLNSQIRFPIGISNSVEPNEIPFRFVIILLLMFFYFSKWPHSLPGYSNQKSESHSWSSSGPHILHLTPSNYFLNLVLPLYIVRTTALVYGPVFLKITWTTPHIILMMKYHASPLFILPSNHTKPCKIPQSNLFFFLL